VPIHKELGLQKRGDYWRATSKDLEHAPVTRWSILCMLVANCQQPHRASLQWQLRLDQIAGPLGGAERTFSLTTGMVPYASSSVKVLRALTYWLRSARFSRVRSTWAHV